MSAAPAEHTQEDEDRPRPFLVLIAAERLDALTQLIGSARARQLIKDLADDAAKLLGQDADVEARGDHVEAVILSGSAAALAVELAALADALRRSVEIEGYVFDRIAVLGATDLHGGTPAGDARGTARAALAQAQATQRPVVLPRAHARSVAEDRFTLMRNLQRMIREDLLELHYQPKLQAREGKIAAAEGLIRWSCAETGSIAPDRFIPIAELTGDIRGLTHWVVGRAIRDLGLLAQRGIHLRLDINLSGALLSDHRFTREILDRLEAAHGMIGIEITETAMMIDPERALTNLRLCAEAGIHLAIDDYGAGFSSLAYLRQLPVSELKIDKSFILGLASQQRDPLLVRSTIDLAHALEMQVTAEGVDSPQVLALLQVMGCDLVQGFYLSRPLPLDTLIAYLSDASQRSRAPDAAIERLRQRIDAARRKGQARS